MSAFTSMNHASSRPIYSAAFDSAPQKKAEKGTITQTDRAGVTLRPVFALTPFTMLDFPDLSACIIWFAGCTMRCPYCHNPQIIRAKGTHSAQDIFGFLEKRQGLLDGVVLSGGEATSYPDLIPMAQRLRAMGYKIKLDTNGLRPDVVRAMIDQNLVDYIALDYKAPRDKFTALTRARKFDSFTQTLDLLCLQEKIGAEIRTTVHTDLLSEDDLNAILQDLDMRGYQGTYFIQNYVADNDRPTLKPLARATRPLDKSRLITPTHFKIAYRNFRQDDM